MKIAVFGAGSTGCYLGAQLALAGLDTSLICRPHIKQSIELNKGITITDYFGNQSKVMPSEIITELSNHQFDVVFVTLKCHHLPQAVEEIKAASNENSALVFMQNGLGSIELIQSELSTRKLYSGITPFNVLQKENAVFHKGTEGDFIFEKFPGSETIQSNLFQADMKCELQSDMKPVIYGKLLLNLNNALNAIVSLPIKQELENRALRIILASAMQEWLDVCESLKIDLAQFTTVKPKLIPKILKLPNWLFKILAKKMLDIDPQARSSMWEDIQAGRKTEVEFLNGQVVAYGKKAGIITPVNQLIFLSIAQLEAGEKVTIEHLIQHLNKAN